jgi:hypothetical protein
VKQEDKNEKIKLRLAKERTALIKDGLPTSKLQKVLYQIFSMYCDHNCSETVMNDLNSEQLHINELMAARLWYRCGVKLASLENLLRLKERRCVAFRDFYALIKKVIDDEESENKMVQGVSTLNFEVWP